MAADAFAHPSPAFSEVEDIVGGRITSVERQDRWRPAWFVEIDRDGESLSIYVRGARDDAHQPAGRSIEYEFEVLKILEAHGIPVPHVYGFSHSLRAIVMQRSPGQANLATAERDDERSSVLAHYVDILVEMHRIEPKLLEALGVRRPEASNDIALGELVETEYRAQKNAPQPMLELFLRWLKRNVPRERSRVTFLTGDAGQFLFANGRVTAVLDLEFATLGDPLIDLAGLRTRDVTEPLGDLSPALRRYAAATGEPIDAAALRFHTVRAAANVPLGLSRICAEPPSQLNFAQYLGWYLVFSRLALEEIAEAEGIELEPPEIPAPAAGARSGIHDVLLSHLEDSKLRRNEVDAAFRIAQYLRELDLRGDAVDAMDLGEAESLLGHRCAAQSQADAELEQLVLEALAPDQEARLVRYFHRRIARREALLRPALRELTDARLQPIALD